MFHGSRDTLGDDRVNYAGWESRASRRTCRSVPQPEFPGSRRRKASVESISPRFHAAFSFGLRFLAAALDAVVAISLRRSGDSFLALACPPFRAISVKNFLASGCIVGI